MRNHHYKDECPKHGQQDHIGAAGGQCYLCLRAREMTHEEKLAAANPLRSAYVQELYDEKSYAFTAPPAGVPYAKWGKDDWIRYIEKYGKWLSH